MQAEKIISTLRKEYPNTKYYLDFSNPMELVVASILSAQCRDVVVNATTKNLFKKYKTAKENANANLENDIKSITFFKNNAKESGKDRKGFDGYNTKKRLEDTAAADEGPWTGRVRGGVKVQHLRY